MRLFFVLLFALIALPPVAYAQDVDAGKILDIQTIETDTGLKAWLIEDRSLPIISIQFYFKGAGSAGDGVDKQGLARMVANTLDEGAGDLDAQAFQKMLQDHSITLSYSAGRDGFSGTFKTLSKYQDKAFALLKSSLSAPRFDDEAIARMRQANQSRIRRALSDPEWIASRLMNDRAFEGHPYALNSGGTLSSLESITREDLSAFHRTKLGRNNLIIAAAGDISAADLSRVLDQIFADFPVVTVPDIPMTTLQNTGQRYVFNKDIPQTVLRVWQPGIARDHPDYHTAQVMNFILGSSGFSSRLMEEVREKRGLTYGIYSGLNTMAHFNSLNVSTSSENKNIGEILSLIAQEWARMKTTRVSEDELASAKNYLIGSLPLSLTSTSALSGLLLSHQIDGLPVDYLEMREQDIQSTTAADIQRVATDLLKPDQFLTIMVGQPENIEAQNLTVIPHAE